MRQRLTKRLIDAIQKPAAEEWHTDADVPGFCLRLHDLRHTYGTMASLHGLTLREVADLMDHKSTVSTMRYVNAANWRKRDNADAVAKIFVK